MFDRLRKTIAALAVVGALAVGASAVANAASNDTTTQGQAAPPAQATAPQDLSHGPGETLLTGDTAAKVKQAAIEKVPSATVIRVETDSDGAAYEAHLQKTDGSYVTVEVDKQFQVTGVENGFGGPPNGGRPSAAN
jgi:uncharacterized membrane protein YkoI